MTPAEKRRSLASGRMWTLAPAFQSCASRTSCCEGGPRVGGGLLPSSPRAPVKLLGTLPPPPPPKPTRKYRLTFLPSSTTVDVDPEKVPYDRHGQPGSILEIALAHGVDIDHACGGVAACSTCHVIVK